MSIGNFKEGNEGNDSNESRMENSESNREKDMESTEARNEDVDQKIDDHDSKSDKGAEDKEKQKLDDDSSEKQSPWERLKSFFKKEGDERNSETSDAIKEKSTEQTDKEKSFADSLRVGAPSMEQQAENAKKFANRENKKPETSESSSDEARTPGGDAWERRFGRIERE